MAQPSSSWEGSIVTAFDLEHLHRTRRITAGVTAHDPEGETVPKPEPSEQVVFISHFERGFRLLASPFFRAFLDFFGFALLTPADALPEDPDCGFCEEVADHLLLREECKPGVRLDQLSVVHAGAAFQAQLGALLQAC
jgi:hypothetical protein